MISPTIGILAGMGPRSTAPFIDMVVTQCQQLYGARDDIDFPRMLICSQPAPFYEDRPVDHNALQAAIREGLLFLQNAGAQFLAIACNTAHIYYPELLSAVDIPLLNMVELAVENLPPSCSKIALIAARPTVESGIYQKAIRQAGKVVLKTSWQDDVDALLAATRETTDPTVFKQHWSVLFQQAHELQVDAVLVACLDLSGILRFAETDLTVIDTAQSLASALVKRWLEYRDAQGDVQAI